MFVLKTCPQITQIDTDYNQNQKTGFMLFKSKEFKMRKYMKPVDEDDAGSYLDPKDI